MTDVHLLLWGTRRMRGYIKLAQARSIYKKAEHIGLEQPRRSCVNNNSENVTHGKERTHIPILILI